LNVKVKICGITNLEDALVSVKAGADYLGFIFYPSSKRSVEAVAARKIIEELRKRQDCPLLVGVFVNETAEFVAQMLTKCDLDLAQLSGDEVPSMIGDHGALLFGRAYKGIQPASATEAEVEAEWYAVPNRPDHLPALLIDTYHPSLRGGTGETGDWATSMKLARQYPGLMIAGGLTAANVAEAVTKVRPFAVDVASGVEASPGKKDPALVRAFVANAKSVDLTS
jgi:phosphoribosylanthranilate isomerase